MQVGPVRDALRYHAVGVWSKIVPCRVGLPRLGRFGDTICRVEMEQLGWDTPATSWSVGWLAHGAGQCCSGRSAIPCGGCASRSWSISNWVAGGRDASVIPSVWVSVFTRRLGWTLRTLMNVLHLFAGCIRCPTVDVRTISGSEQVGG